ncbi:MAG: endonuclease [Flavobacteriaceae bacterium]
MKIYSTLLIFLISQFLFCQIVINELDCDTPSTDTLEFIELKSDTPNYLLDGFIVVLFNGSTSGDDRSYFSIDLTGYSTDVNGLLLIGSNNVSPVPQLLISADIIQNGADAVAIYQASWEDFPGGTLATTTNLIDALVYDTSDPDDTNLMTLLGITEQINENENANKDNESIQRNNDGTYTIKVPTPRQLNDGSGIVLNGVFISVNQNQYDEGDMFDITITTEQNVTEQLDLEIILDNETFNTSDYTGNTSLSIPIGQNMVSTTIMLVDDSDDEGDEVLNIMLPELPDGYLQLNNNLKIRVVDDDYTVAAWGIPTSPSYGMVSSTQPIGYYDSLDGKVDVALRQAIQDIIADPTIVRAQTYADVIDILKEADQNPANSNQVWLVYTEQGRPKLDFQTGSNNTGTWNREHTYPRSRGGFNSIDLDDIADGPDIFWTTKADSLRHGNSDAHALRAVDGPENSSRGNQNYGPSEYDGPSGNLGSFKGDLARSVLYMTVRYNEIEVVNGYPTASPSGQLGDLTTLLEWHRSDPPDDFEMNRNNIIYTWQFNRNPFIDQPDLVEYIWGDQVGEIWDQTLSLEVQSSHKIKVYPNPSKGQINIKGIEEPSLIKIYTSQGIKVFESKFLGNMSLNLNFSSGIYLMHIIQDHKSIFKKLVIE